MAQSGYTPIQLYFSTTAAAVPVNTNLANGELAINITDGKLYYKDNTGTVKVIAGAGGAGVAGGSTTQVQYNSSGSLAGSANMTFDGTTLTAAGFSGPHNGTVGATTANTGAFTTLSASSTVTLSGGTANGVTYLNGSKVLTSGSALTFNGTTFSSSNTGASYLFKFSDTTNNNSLGLYSDATNMRLMSLDNTFTTFKSMNFYASPFVFYENGTEAMRLTSTGLGIGTSSPQRKLSIANGGPVVEIDPAGIGSANPIYFNYNRTTSVYTTPQYWALAHNWMVNGGTSAMLLDSAGNLGLGVTPTSVQSGYKAIQIGATVGGGIVSAGTDTYFTNNAYVTGGSWYFGSTGYASYYNQSGGVHAWTTSSASGTAGGVATMTERLRIGPAGQIGIGGANYGTAGQVLTSNGSGAAPSWQAGGGGSAATPTALGTVYGNTDNSSLTFLGYQSGNSNTGSQNTAVGNQAAYSNTTGSYNSAFGYVALKNNTTGDQNTAIGRESLFSCTSGSKNTGVGLSSLYSLSTGTNNTGIGHGALANNTTASNGTAVGYQAAYSVTTTSGITAIGYQAGYSDVNPYGAFDANTYLGYRAGYNTTTANAQTFIGTGAGFNKTTGALCTLVGSNSGYALTTGAGNTALGYGTMINSTTLSYSVAIGDRCMGTGVATGIYNVGVGGVALNSLTSGGSNVGLGYQSLTGITTGSGNTGLGMNTLLSAVSTSYSTAVGYNALVTETGTGYNSALGYRALYNLTTGTNNIGIGYNGGADAGVVNITSQSNTIALGNSSITNAYVAVAWTTSSDARNKTEINPVPHGLNFVNQLNPVSFRFKKSRQDDTPIGDTKYGFLAQDILAIEGSDSVVVDAKDAENLKYVDQHMTAILVKAIQELKAEFDAYKLIHP